MNPLNSTGVYILSSLILYYVNSTFIFTAFILEGDYNTCNIVAHTMIYIGPAYKNTKF